MSEQPTTPISGRSRARRNVIGASKHRDEYVRLMEAGWSSLTLERYALHRYGEEIPASTFRTYKAKKKIETRVTAWKQGEKVIDREAALDVITRRAELIELQEARIAIDVKHEQQMQKLFGSTRGEIQTLNALLDAHKTDLQDLGLLPKAGEHLTIDGPARQPTPEDAPKARRLSDLIGVEEEQEMQAARLLHLQVKAASNGHAG